MPLEHPHLLDGLSLRLIRRQSAQNLRGRLPYCRERPAKRRFPNKILTTETTDALVRLCVSDALTTPNPGKSAIFGTFPPIQNELCQQRRRELIADLILFLRFRNTNLKEIAPDAKTSSHIGALRSAASALK